MFSFLLRFHPLSPFYIYVYVYLYVYPLFSDSLFVSQLFCFIIILLYFLSPFVVYLLLLILTSIFISTFHPVF